MFLSRPTPRPSPPLTPIGRCRVYGSHLQATNSQCQTHGVGKITKRREVGSSALPPPVGRTPAGEGQIALFRTTAWKVYVPSHRPSPICKALPGNCTTTTRPYGPGLTLPALEPQFVSAPPGPRGGPLGRGWGGLGGWVLLGPTGRLCACGRHKRFCLVRQPVAALPRAAAKPFRHASNDSL